MMGRIYSFDILDTCLCRTCGSPYSVFDILARKVIGEKISRTQLADFRFIRINGEFKSRRNSKSEDVTIDDIYRECNFTGLTSCPNDKILKYEIEVEKSVLRPIKKTLDVIRKLHSDGKSVLYISDMYLPRSFFVEILIKYGFWKEGDKLYVSCEIGKTKESGNLYNYISKDLNIGLISCYRWHHYGDNRHSDYLLPLKKGIRGHLVTYNYSYYQEYFRKMDYDVTECYMSRAAGISRSLLLASNSSVIEKFATDIIAPLYVSFTYNVLKDAETRGLNKLFFLARDSSIIYRIAKEMSSHFPSIDLEYLYASRKALYLPSLDDISKESLLTILPSKSKSDDEFFDILQIDCKGATRETFLKSGFSQEQENALKERWIEQKTNVIGYFKQEGLAENNANIGIVDIRGSRKCQRCINKILSDNNYKKVFAYYLEVTADRVLPNSKDEYDAFYFADFHQSPNYANINNLVLLLERYFCISRAKRTIGYLNNDGKFEPEFESGEYLPDYYDTIGETNGLICIKYCHEFFINQMNLFSINLFNYSLALIASFSKLPRREYVKALLGIEFNESKYHSLKIVNRLTLRAIVRKNFKWTRGSLCLSFPFLLPLYEIIKKKSSWTINRICQCL